MCRFSQTVKSARPDNVNVPLDERKFLEELSSQKGDYRRYQFGRNNEGRPGR